MFLSEILSPKDMGCFLPRQWVYRCCFAIILFPAKRFLPCAFPLWVLLCFLKGGMVLMLISSCTDFITACPGPYQRIYILIITIDQVPGVYFSVWFLFLYPHCDLHLPLMLFMRRRQAEHLVLRLSSGNLGLRFTD